MGKKPYILWFDEIGLNDLPVVEVKMPRWERCERN